MIPVFINHSSARIPKKFLISWLAHISQKLKAQRVITSHQVKQQLVVVFLDAPQARQLNKKFRGKNYPTDVLSFNSDDPDCLGELVLCPQVLQAQAKEHGLSLRHETGYLVLHGVLHLLGFEHERGGSEAKKMYALQDKIFAEIDNAHRPIKMPK